jgi:hypothetical protein
MLGDFQHKALAIVAGFQGVENAWQFAIKLNVDNGANYLGDLAFNMDAHLICPS